MDSFLLEEIRQCGCELLERYLPRLVVAAQDNDGISRLIALAARKRLRICATGTGSSFPANYVPPEDLLFLLTAALNQLFELHPLDAVAIVGAGMTTANLGERLRGTDLEFPQSLADYPGTIGGALLGPDTDGRRHREIRRRLLGMELVNPLGKVLRFGGLSVKNVVGYDYWTFLTGTQGRFGIITSLTINLERLPPLEIPIGVESSSFSQDSLGRWICANLEKNLDPDGIFVR